jgi:hypothetical protein
MRVQCDAKHDRLLAAMLHQLITLVDDHIREIPAGLAT